MARLSEMQAFVTVVDKGGFTGAADHLSMSKSAVSKHISALEDRLGARLLNRTTRRVSPTEIGLDYYDRAKKVLSDAAEADEMVTSMQASPKGRLKISMPVSWGLKYGRQVISKFLIAYPDITVDLVLDDRFVDIISEGYDLAMRIGTLSDSTLKARKFGETRSLIVASPAYLSRHGRPEKIDDLNNHHLLHYSITSNPNIWKLVSKTGEERQVRTQGALMANNGDILLQGALDGLGIAYLPSFFLCDLLRENKLVVVLEDHPQPVFGLHLVYPPGLYTQPKTRAFIDFVADCFKGKGVMDW